MSSHLRTTRPPFPTRWVLITCLLLMSLFNPSFAQEEGSGDNTAVSVVFAEVSDTQIVGESPQLGIKLSTTRENDNDVVSIQLSDNKTVVLSRNVGNLNFYVSSKQLDTATSFVAEDKELTAVDSLTQYLWQYRGYNELGDTLLDALLVLSNWPQGVAFEEPELSTDNPDRGTLTYPLTVTIIPNTTLTGKVTGGTSLGSINCGGINNICQGNYGGMVTLTATPVAGYYGFKGWTGACTNTTTTCTINMTSPKTVTAIFTELPKYALSIAVSPSTAGKVTSAVGGINCGSDSSVCNVNLGGKVTLTATPSLGYSFKGWSGACTGTATTCTVSMTAAKSVTATFEVKTYPLTITKSANLGSVSSSPAGINCDTICSYNFEEGSNVTLTATAISGTFTGWSGGCTGTAPTCTVNMSAAKSVTANFSSGYLLSLSTTVDNGGTFISPFSWGAPVIQSSPAGINCGGNSGNVCSYLFNKDSTVTLNILGSRLYAFSAWGGACADKAQNGCTVSMTTAQTVTAAFVRNMSNVYVEVILNIYVPHNMYVPSSSVGTVTTSPSSGISCYSVNSSQLMNSFQQQQCQGFNSFGKTVVLTAMPAAGYKFTEWTGGACSGTTNPCTVVMNESTNVFANFAPQ